MTSDLPLEPWERVMKSAITKTKQKRNYCGYLFEFLTAFIPFRLPRLQSSYFEHAGHVSLAREKSHDPLLMLTLYSQLNRSA